MSAKPKLKRKQHLKKKKKILYYSTSASTHTRIRVHRLTALCPHLQHDLLVDGELGDDVREQQVAAVLAGGVDAGLGQQAGPGEGHEAPQLAVAALVVVVDVVRRVLHQQRGELQQLDAQRVQQVRLLLRVQDLEGRRGRGGEEERMRGAQDRRRDIDSF